MNFSRNYFVTLGNIPLDIYSNQTRRDFEIISNDEHISCSTGHGRRKGGQRVAKAPLGF